MIVIETYALIAAILLVVGLIVRKPLMRKISKGWSNTKRRWDQLSREDDLNDGQLVTDERVLSQARKELQEEEQRCGRV